MIQKMSLRSVWPLIGILFLFSIVCPLAVVADAPPAAITYDPDGGDLQNQLNNSQALLVRYRQMRVPMKKDPTNHGDGRSARSLLSAAEAQAAAQGKNVFLVFHASWCGPCYLLHHFLNAPQIAPLMKSSYVILEIDILERKRSDWENPGGQSLYRKYGGKGGVPFYAVLAPSGKKLADSNSKDDGVVVVPYDADTREPFLALLKRTGARMNDKRLSQMKALVNRYHYP